MDGAHKLERAIEEMESALEPLFAQRRHRDFFDQIHALRQRFRAARLTPGARAQLWQRLNDLAETAKQRQAGEFATRDAENLARWRDQLARAQAYADALDRETSELASRTGPPAEVARWQQRIAEKRARRTSVQATVAQLQRKVADVVSRQEARGERQG